MYLDGSVEKRINPEWSKEVTDKVIRGEDVSPRDLRQALAGYTYEEFEEDPHRWAQLVYYRRSQKQIACEERLTRIRDKLADIGLTLRPGKVRRLRHEETLLQAAIKRRFMP